MTTTKNADKISLYVFHIYNGQNIFRLFDALATRYGLSNDNVMRHQSLNRTAAMSLRLALVSGLMILGSTVEMESTGRLSMQQCKFN